MENNSSKKEMSKWRVYEKMSNWSYDVKYGWMWIGHWRPWTKFLEWWYNP